MSQSFFSSRLGGSAPLETVFWRDMLGVGTVLNIVCAIAAFAMLAGGAPGWAAVAVLLLPLPWNFFVFIAVWRSAAREGGPAAATARVVAVVWLVVMVAL